MDRDYVLDTSVLLHYTRTNSPVAAQVETDYALLQSPFRPMICSVSLGEMLAFATMWGEARTERLEAVLAEFTVIDIGREDVLSQYALLHQYSKKGVNVGQNDLWIAAAANAVAATVLTTDGNLLRLPAGTVKVIRVNAKTGLTESCEP